MSFPAQSPYPFLLTLAIPSYILAIWCCFVEGWGWFVRLVPSWMLSVEIFCPSTPPRITKETWEDIPSGFHMYLGCNCESTQRDKTHMLQPKFCWESNAFLPDYKSEAEAPSHSRSFRPHVDRGRETVRSDIRYNSVRTAPPQRTTAHRTDSIRRTGIAPGDIVLSGAAHFSLRLSPT